MKKKAYFFSKKSIKILDEFRKKGEVHSIFRNSLNLFSSDGSLLTLLSKEKEIYRNPISIVIDEPHFENWKISPKEEVIYTGTKLNFSRSDIVIDMSNRITWSSSFRYFGPLPSPEIIRKNVETLKFFIKVMKWEKGMLPIITGSYSESPYVKKAIQVLNLFEASDTLNLSVLKGLIGLGDGLTPSGDDFLSGLLVVLYYFGCYLNFKGLIEEEVRKLLENAEVKTNIISAAFLHLAGEGEAFFLLREIVKDLIGRKGFGMENIRALIDYGDTSGASILSGVIFGIEYVLRHIYREVKEVTV